MTRRTASIDPEYFNALYGADPDPWRFASSDYERGKYAATMAALPSRRFAAGLEVGCSIGVLTSQIAQRCDALLALDVAEAALAQARARCASRHPAVRFEQRAVPGDWPDGRFDLIMLSEVLYYLDAGDLRETARLTAAALQPGGCVILVHYLLETDYPATGDEAADGFIAASGLSPVLQVREPEYRIDRLERPAGSPG